MHWIAEGGVDKREQIHASEDFCECFSVVCSQETQSDAGQSGRQEGNDRHPPCGTTEPRDRKSMHENVCRCGKERRNATEDGILSTPRVTPTTRGG